MIALQQLRQYIRAHLHEDLCLHRLAELAHSTPFRLQRRFNLEVGLSPAQYVEQSRLQAAALVLAVGKSRVLDVALSCGYNNHETFSRAFRRHFRCTPQQFRSDHQPTAMSAQPQRCHGLSSFALSPPRVVHLQSLWLAYLRHIGPYDQVPDQLWQQLSAALRQHKLQGCGWLGIGHDDPRTTPAEHCRFDAAVILTEPYEFAGNIDCRQMPGLTCVVTSHVGGYQTLPTALPEIYQRARGVTEYQITALPLLEFYHARIVAADEFSYTDICLPASPTTPGEADQASL